MRISRCIRHAIHAISSTYMTLTFVLVARGAKQTPGLQAPREVCCSNILEKINAKWAIGQCTEEIRGSLN